MSYSVNLKRTIDYIDNNTVDNGTNVVNNTMEQTQKKQRLNFAGRNITIFSLLPQELIFRIISELSLKVIRNLAITCPYNYKLFESCVAILGKNELQKLVTTFFPYTKDIKGFSEIQEKVHTLSQEFLNIPKIHSTQFDSINFFSSFVSLETLKVFSQNSKLHEWAWIMKGLKNSMGLIENLNDEALTEEVSNDEATDDEVANDEATDDEVANDEATDDEVANDEVANDEATDDEVANDEVANNEAIVDEAVNDEAIVDKTANHASVWLFKAAMGCGVKETELLIKWYLNTCYEKIQLKRELITESTKPIPNLDPPIFPIGKSLFIMCPADKYLEQFFFGLIMQGQIPILSELFSTVSDFLLDHPLFIGSNPDSLPECLTCFLYSPFVTKKEILDGVYLYLKENSSQLNSKALDIFNMTIQIAELLYCMESPDFQTELNNCIVNAKQISLSSSNLKDRMIRYIILYILLPEEEILKQDSFVKEINLLIEEIKTPEIKKKMVDKLNSLLLEIKILI